MIVVLEFTSQIKLPLIQIHIENLSTCEYFVFVINKQNLKKMNFFSPYYQFYEAMGSPFGLVYPSFSFEPSLYQVVAKEPSLDPEIKSSDSAPKKQKTPLKIMARIKKLIKQLHHQGVLNRKTHWSSQQDELLRRLVEEEKTNWIQIPHSFRGRTQNMCYSRYRRIKLSYKLKKWSQQEQQQLLQLVTQHGEKWKKISQKLTKYTPKQIRQRYLNYLRPNIDKSDFTTEEDLKICRFVVENGKHWRKLQEALPGRPEGTIKGRYYAKLQEIIERAHDQDD